MENTEETFDDVKKVILAGAKNQPRAVLQILRSFISRWKIVEVRRERDPKYKIDKKLLTLILILQNDYPELFSRVVRYPEYLLSLSALINNEPVENYYTPIDIDEINNLGLAVDARTKAYAYDVRYQSEIVRLFEAANITGYLQNLTLDEQINEVAKHVTLSSGNVTTLSRNYDILEVLLSGDIVRIQNLQRQSDIAQEVKDIFEQYALGNLLFLLRTLKDVRQKKTGDVNQVDLTLQIENLLFAWGQLKGLGSINKLEEFVLKNEEISSQLRFRCLYAIFHSAYQGDEQAINVVLGVLTDHQKYDIALLEKTCYLLRYIKFYSSIDKIIDAFSNFSSWGSLVQDTFTSSVVNAYDSNGSWGKIFIEEVVPDRTNRQGHFASIIQKINMNIRWDQFVGILQKINESKEKHYWSIDKYGSYFREQIDSFTKIEQLAMVQEIVKKYFDLLLRHNNRGNEEGKVTNELIAIIPYAQGDDQETILNTALDIQYNLQKYSKDEMKDEWQNAWRDLEITENLQALRTIKVYSPGAVEFIGYLYNKAPIGWRGGLSSKLVAISKRDLLEMEITDEMKDKIQKTAQEICSDLGL